MKINLKDEILLNILVGFAGVLGFACLSYFKNYDVRYLWSIGMFATFSLWIHAKILSRKDFDKTDKKYLENIKKAKAFTSDIMKVVTCGAWAVTAILIVFSHVSVDGFVVMISAIYLINTYVYIGKLYTLERSR